MSTREAPVETSLTTAQSLLVDHIGNEVYSSHYAERKAYRFIIACGTVVLLGSLGMNLSSPWRNGPFSAQSAVERFSTESIGQRKSSIRMGPESHSCPE